MIWKSYRGSEMFNIGLYFLVWRKITPGQNIRSMVVIGMFITWLI